jgi:hypothetical protein
MLTEILQGIDQTNPFVLAAYFFQLLYFIGFLYLIRMYQKRQIRTTLILAIYFLAIGIAGVLSIVIIFYFQEYVYLLNLIPLIPSAILMIAGLDMTENTKWYYVMVPIVVVLFVIVIILLINDPGDIIYRTSRISAIILLMFPTVIIFLWGYYKLNSGKSLGFAISVILFFIGGIIGSVGGFSEAFGIAFILSAITAFLAIFGVFDKFLNKETS